MHFSYTYIKHEVEIFQEYSDFLFLKLWLNARGTFDSKKLCGHLKLKSIYLSFHYRDDSTVADKFNRDIQQIYNQFAKLSKSERRELRRWYKTNNNIEGLCRNRNLKPVDYKHLINKHPVLGKLLKSFYGNLYGKNSPFNLAAFGSLKKMIKKHYSEFMEINDEEICPFCGIKNIKGKHHKKREAYDHFLPKGEFPFNSINFRNLAPMCNDCNSSYKLEQNPLMYINPLKKKDNGERIKSFYPYRAKPFNLEISINLNKLDFNNLESIDVHLDFTCNEGLSYKEQIESWKTVFGIDERYKAKILGKRGGKKWYDQIDNGVENYRKLTGNPQLSKTDIYNLKMSEINEDKLSDSNFIKKAFLNQCKDRGLFN